MIKVWCPGHVSAFFVPPHRAFDVIKDIKQGIIEGTANYLEVLKVLEGIGSKGAGFSVEKGCTCIARVKRLSKDKSHVYKYESRGKCLKIISNMWGKTSDLAIRTLMGINPINGTVHLEMVPEAPMKAGFGMSASAVLSQLIALKHLFSLYLEDHMIVKIAHAAEILASTGLGDISALAPGLEVRSRPGLDPVGKVHHLVYDTTVSIILFSGDIPTTNVINDEVTIERIRDVGGRLLPRLIAWLNDPVLLMDAILGVSYEFTIETGITGPEVCKALEILKNMGIDAGGIMIGHGIWSTTPLNNIINVLRTHDIVYSTAFETRIYNGPNHQIYGRPSILG